MGKKKGLKLKISVGANGDQPLRRSNRPPAPVKNSDEMDVSPPSSKRARLQSIDDDSPEQLDEHAEVEQAGERVGQLEEEQDAVESDSDDDKLLMVYQQGKSGGAAATTADSGSDVSDAELSRSPGVTGSGKRKAGIKAAERLAKALKSPSPEEDYSSSPIPPGGGDITCPVCSAPCSTKLKLSQHMHELHPSLYPFQCDKCPSSFNAANKLAEHDRRVHQKLKRFACDQCPAMFYDKTELKHHMRSHITVRAFACPHADCGMTFKTDEHLRSHMTRRHMERQFACIDCTRRFTEDRQLQQHVAKVHAAGAQCFKCDECGHAYHMEKVLGQHMVMVHSKTLDGILLNKVEPRHTVDNWTLGVSELNDNSVDSDALSLSQCVNFQGDSLGDASGVKNEMDDEPNEGPVHGIERESGRATPASQGKQTQVHRYGCSECDRSYTSVDSLRVHVRSVHRGISRYQCDKCTKRFNTAYQLGKHVRQVHRSGQEALVCDVCGVALPSQRALQLHLVKIHAQTIDGISINKVEQSTPEPGDGEGPDCQAATSSGGGATSAIVAQCDDESPQMGLTPQQKVQFAQAAAITRRRYQCGECTRQFGDAADFAKHQRAVHAEGGRCELCLDCGAAFPSKSALAKHSLVSVSDFGECSVNVADHQKTMDGIHVNVVHWHQPAVDAANAAAANSAAGGGTPPGGKSGAQYTCPECNRPYGSIKSLSMHVLSVHRDVRRYACSDCSRRFSTAYQLGQHVRQVHTEGAPCHRCEDCDAAFPSRNALCKHMLYAHQRTIEGISVTMGFGVDKKKTSAATKGAPNQLTAESKSPGKTDQPSTAAGAQQTANPESNMRFACNACPRRFSSGYQLDKHAKAVHRKPEPQPSPTVSNGTNKSPPSANSTPLSLNGSIESRRRFACASCPRTFNHTYKLAEHVRRVHAQTAASGGPLRCDQCGAAYPTRSTLVTHYARAHGLDRTAAAAQAQAQAHQETTQPQQSTEPPQPAKSPPSLQADPQPQPQPQPQPPSIGTAAEPASMVLTESVMPALSQALAQYARQQASGPGAQFAPLTNGHDSGAGAVVVESASDSRSEASASTASQTPCATATVIECPPCGMTFDCNDDYRKHFRAVHLAVGRSAAAARTSNRPSKCGACGQSFASPSLLASHERQAHGAAALTSPQPRQTQNSPAAARPTNSETDLAPVKTEPDSSVSDEHQLKSDQRHSEQIDAGKAAKTINIAQVDGGFKCVYCEKVFDEVNVAVGHQMSEHLV